MSLSRRFKFGSFTHTRSPPPPPLDLRRYGFAPAMAYAVAAKDASTVGLGGKHGGRLGARYFGPMCTSFELIAPLSLTLSPPPPPPELELIQTLMKTKAIVVGRSRCSLLLCPVSHPCVCFVWMCECFSSSFFLCSPRRHIRPSPQDRRQHLRTTGGVASSRATALTAVWGFGRHNKKYQTINIIV